MKTESPEKSPQDLAQELQAALDENYEGHNDVSNDSMVFDAEERLREIGSPYVKVWDDKRCRWIVVPS